MSSNTAITGRGGAVWINTKIEQNWTATTWMEVARITNWSLEQKPGSITSWADSDTAGFLTNAPGARSASFTTEGKFTWDTVMQGGKQWDLFRGGDYARVKLYVRETDLTPAEPDPNTYPYECFYDFNPALCTNFSLTVNVDTEEVVGWTASWVNCGPFTVPGYSYWKDGPTAVSA